jgi:hypothetical protein
VQGAKLGEAVTTAQKVALLDKHTAKAARYLHENGVRLDSDDRADIWNAMAGLLREYDAARAGAPPREGEG